MLDIEQRVKLISSYPFFTLLSPADLHQLAQHMYEVTVAEGEVIVKEGAIIDCIFLIQDGIAEVSRTSQIREISEDIVVAKLGKGDAIGLMETGFFSQSKVRTATVIALSKMHLLGIGLISFNHFMQRSGGLYPNFRKGIEAILRVNFIKGLQPFASLSADTTSKLIANLKEINLVANQYLFREGDSAEVCYLLEKGEIDILRTNKQNNQDESIAQIQAPAILGEAAILTTAKTRNASALTKTECSLLILDREFLLHIFSKEEQASEAMTNLLLSRYQPKSLQHVKIEINQAKSSEAHHVLHNTKTNQRIELSPQEWIIWKNIDGKHTLSDLIIKFGKKFRDDGEKIEKFIFDLKKNKFIEFQVTLVPELRKKKRTENNWMGSLKNYINRLLKG